MNDNIDCYFDSFNDDLSKLSYENESLFGNKISFDYKFFEDIPDKKEDTDKKRTGRKKVKEEQKKEHTKYNLDNMRIKILINFVSFLIKFVNAFLEDNHIYDLKFENVSGYFFKKLSNLVNLKKIINSPLYYILEQDISNKFKLKDLNSNRILLKEIVQINNQQLKNILNMKFKYLYSEIFLLNNSKKLKNEFGIKKKLNMLNDFLERIKKKYEIEYVNLISTTSYKLISHIEKTKPKRNIYY